MNPHSSQKHQQRWAYVADQIIVQWKDYCTPAAIVLGILLLQSVRDGVHLGLRLLQPNTVLEAADHEVMMFAANGFLLVGPAHGRPHVGIVGHAEIRCHYSGDEVAGTIQRDVASDDVAIRGEVILPETVAEQHDVRMTGLIFVRVEYAADRRLHTQR